MARSFTAQDIIALPVMTAQETVALGRALETRAARHHLHGALAETLADVTATRTALAGALALKQAQSKPTSPEAIAADHALDRAWSATCQWLGAWARLGAPPSKRAGEVLGVLFPDGLSFVNLPYLGEWGESKTRLDVIGAQHLDKDFAALGGKAFLDALRAAQQAYGKALGVTDAAPAQPAPADVRGAMHDAQGALREYVAAVAGSVRRKQPKTSEVAQDLLGPLIDWQPERAATAAAPAQPNAPAVPAPPAPQKPAPPVPTADGSSDG
jgi:hypothetical protein